jgi:hypothetical protein
MRLGRYRPGNPRCSCRRSARGTQIHPGCASCALDRSPFQFIPGLRQSHRAVHRWTGRVYVAACVIAGFAGLVTAFHSSGGPVSGVGGWYFGGAVDHHNGPRMVGGRATQVRTASTVDAVQLSYDLWCSDSASSNPVGFMLGYKSYSAMSVWLAHTAWIPNALLVAPYTLWVRRSPTRARLAEIA